MRAVSPLFLSMGLVFAAACGGDDRPSADAGTRGDAAGDTDAGSMDAAPAPDSGRDGGDPADTGRTDAGPTDAGPHDAGGDGGAADGGPPDAGPPDAGPLDAGGTDAGPLDAGGTDAGPLDAGGTDAGPLDGGTDAGGTGTCSSAPECVNSVFHTPIASPADCYCLLCPFFPMTRTEDAARQAQYAVHCTPGFDAMGRPCPIPICLVPPPLVCHGGVCEHAP
jgi:hypothetical protein